MDKKFTPSTLAEAKKSHIIQTLEHFEGSVAKAAESLGITRAGLYVAMKKLGRVRTGG